MGAQVGLGAACGSHDWTGTSPARLNRRLCAPGGSSLASSDQGERRRARDPVAAGVKAARDLGAAMLAGPMYTPVGYLTGARRTSEEWKWTVDSWQQLAAVVDSAGIEIGIEPL